jgi:hypothetical protein
MRVAVQQYQHERLTKDSNMYCSLSISQLTSSTHGVSECHDTHRGPTCLTLFRHHNYPRRASTAPRHSIPRTPTDQITTPHDNKATKQGPQKRSRLITSAWYGWRVLNAPIGPACSCAKSGESVRGSMLGSLGSDPASRWL